METYLHAEQCVCGEIGHDIVDHAVAEWVLGRDFCNNRGGSTQQFRDFIWTGLGWIDAKGGDLGNFLPELLCSRFGVLGSHDGAHDGDAVQALAGRLGLVGDSLDIVEVDAADGNGSNVRVEGGDVLQDFTNAGGADDGFCIRFAVGLLAIPFFSYAIFISSKKRITGLTWR